MTRKEFGKMIAALRERDALSQADFGKKFGVSQQAVFGWESGTSLPSKKTAIEICRILGINVANVERLRHKRIVATLQQSYDLKPDPPNITPTYDHKSPHKIPLISWVQAGEWTCSNAPENPGFAERWIDTNATTSECAFALTVHGDSMEPKFMEGDILVIDPERPFENGNFVVAKNGEEATFKQLVIDGSSVYLKPLNPRYPIKDMTGKEFVIVGVAVQKITDLL